MLATFVIGLREGLEAALIVGIIAAFLRNNGKRLTPMWLGVGLAVALSIGIGVILDVVQHSLNQRAQEGMETVISALAVVFVTGMVVWMATHARGLKKELETQATAAIGDGSSRALVVMAFLAVLKEGFETAVFLLATFNAATNPLLAALGAFLGVLTATVIGYGIYTGGVRINLGRFFSWTRVFLILVAAGLVLQALHTAHGAGWINAGQQSTFDLTWLTPYGTSIRSALITGVLGIPPEPRRIELVGYLAYLIPMAAIVYWPAKHRPGKAAAQRIRLGIAAALTVVAAVLALAIGAPATPDPGPAPVLDATGTKIGTATLSGNELVLTPDDADATSFELGKGVEEFRSGAQATKYALPAAGVADAPSSLTLAQVTELNGGRIPVGIDVRRNPGPFDATWAGKGSGQVWVADGVLLDASSDVSYVVTLSGGGLTTARTLTATTLPGASSGVPDAWNVDPAYAEKLGGQLGDLTGQRDEAHLWGRLVPLALLIAAVGVLLTWWRHRGSSTAPDPPQTPTPSEPGAAAGVGLSKDPSTDNTRAPSAPDTRKSSHAHTDVH